MKRITFDDMLEQSDPRYGVPLANVNDIKNIKGGGTIQNVNTIDNSEVVNKLEVISSKLDKQNGPVLFPKSMIVSNQPSFKNDANRIIQAINGLELKVELPEEKEKEEKEEDDVNLMCYKVSDAAEPVTGYQYFGFINKDGGWYILFNDAVESSVRYKFGKEDYTSGWDRREEFDYKLLNEAYDEIKD